MPRVEPDIADQADRSGVPTGLALTTLVLSILGVAVTTYLTIAHYTTVVTLACPTHGVINCETVTSSEQSAILSIPVALLGLIFYIAMTLLCIPQAWSRPQLAYPRLGAATIGVAFVFYLVYTELFTLDAICLWCTSVHVITLTLFALVAFATAMDSPRRDRLRRTNKR